MRLTIEEVRDIFKGALLYASTVAGLTLIAAVTLVVTLAFLLGATWCIADLALMFTRK